MDEISFYSFLRTSFRKGYVRRINRLRNTASRNPVGRTNLPSSIQFAHPPESVSDRCDWMNKTDVI
jgi:hypothetical protein